MVQVDVFWAYGWGASLAAAAGRPLVKKAEPFSSHYFVSSVLFLALIWAPTGMLLLLRHPSWETMQAAPTLQSLSEWLVLGFGITNITQGIIGFGVGLYLLRRGQEYLAQLNWLAGYFGMFFILLYGWDGLGYDRFLYDRDMLAQSPAWTPGVATAGGALGAFGRFFKSSVAQTLYLDGVYLLPPFFWLTSRWRRTAAHAAGTTATLPSPLVRIVTYLGGVFLVGLGGAAFCALTVRGIAYLLGIKDQVARGLGQIPQIPVTTSAHIASYCIGLPLGLVILWFAALRPGGPVQSLLSPIMENLPMGKSENKKLRTEKRVNRVR